MLWFGAAPILGVDTLTSPVDLLLDALLVAGVTWLALDLVERRRVTPPRPRLLIPARRSLIWLGGTYVAAGVIVTWLFSAYEQFLREIVSHASLDVLHFSLHPIGAARIAIGFGLVLIHASVVWSAVAVLRLPSLLWRTPRQRDVHAVAAGGFVLGCAAALLVLGQSRAAVPVAPLIVATAVAVGV